MARMERRVDDVLFELNELSNQKRRVRSNLTRRDKTCGVVCIPKRKASAVVMRCAP